MASTYELIASQTLGSDTATVTFSSIPSTYDDLVLLANIRSTYASSAIGAKLRFNGAATDANHSLRRIYGSGSAVVSDSQSYCILGVMGGSTTTADTFSSMEAYIPGYTGATSKSISATSTTEDNNTTAYIVATANLWSDTSAITAIEVFSGGYGSFVTGSSFYLYGVTHA